jgi:alpha-tubulin suppressor-like RCC1 family protein
MGRWWTREVPAVATGWVAGARRRFAALLVSAVALGMMAIGGSPAFAGPAATAASPTATPAGTALAWGFNVSGQLGNGTTAGSRVPMPVSLPAGTTITAVAGGGLHALALTSTGTVLAWGNNAEGQLGNGTTTGSPVPVPVSLPAGTRITAIAAAGWSSLALTSTGTVLAWGLNNDGQLGNGTTVGSSATPVAVRLPARSKITAIAAGAYHSLALTSTGTVLAWGLNSDGELGNGTTDDSRVPLPVYLPGTVTAIAAGSVSPLSPTVPGGHSLALTSTGTVFAWGLNSSGQLGNGTTDDSTVPVPVPHGNNVRAIAAGNSFSLAVTVVGTILAWGANEAGQLGNGTTTGSGVPVPAKLPAGTRITAVATTAGGSHSLALTSTGAALAWGYNGDGQLGNGTTDVSTVPVPVSLPAGTKITAIATGNLHSLAVAQNPTTTQPEPGPTPPTGVNPQANLPVTGDNLAVVLAAGILLLLIGAALTLATHRRRSAHHTTG